MCLYVKLFYLFMLFDCVVLFFVLFLICFVCLCVCVCVCVWVGVFGGEEEGRVTNAGVVVF